VYNGGSPICTPRISSRDARRPAAHFHSAFSVLYFVLRYTYIIYNMPLCAHVCVCACVSTIGDELYDHCSYIIIIYIYNVFRRVVCAERVARVQPKYSHDETRSRNVVAQSAAAVNPFKSKFVTAAIYQLPGRRVGRSFSKTDFGHPNVPLRIAAVFGRLRICSGQCSNCEKSSEGYKNDITAFPVQKNIPNTHPRVTVTLPQPPKNTTLF
jgi:hypothetical protein